MMKRATIIALIFFASYHHTYTVLATIGYYYENSTKNIYKPINPEVLKWQEKYYHLQIHYKQVLHQIRQTNKTAWSYFEKEIYQLNEKNKRTLSLIEKEYIKQLNHERWFQNFLYTSLFTFGFIAYKTFLNR